MRILHDFLINLNHEEEVNLMKSQEEIFINSIKYCKNFPKLSSQMRLSDDKVYKILTLLPTSKYYQWSIRDVKATVKREEAYRLFTYLALQNERNKSLLEKVSEQPSSSESYPSSKEEDKDGDGGRCSLDDSVNYSKSIPSPKF